MSDATPIDEWALDQDNQTLHHRTVRVREPSKQNTDAYGPGLILKTATAYENYISTRLSPEEARALATLLLFAADKAEGKHG